MKDIYLTTEIHRVFTEYHGAALRSTLPAPYPRWRGFGPAERDFLTSFVNFAELVPLKRDSVAIRAIDKISTDHRSALAVSLCSPLPALRSLLSAPCLLPRALRPLPLITGIPSFLQATIPPSRL